MPWSPLGSREVECTENTGLDDDALRLMGMGAGGEAEALVTPACKKPRLADSVELNLALTPPPTIEQQSAAGIPIELLKAFISFSQ